MTDLAMGATVFGSGGGGRTDAGAALARAALKENGPVALLDIADVPSDRTVITVGGLGSSVVVEERLPGPEFPLAVRTLHQHIGSPQVVLLAFEIGGINALLAVAAAARLGLPLLDADAMGRAFGLANQTTLSAVGISASPMALASPTGETFIITANDNARVAQIALASLPTLGGLAGTAFYPAPVEDVREAVIPNTYSTAIRIGRMLRAAQRDIGLRPRFAEEIGAEWIFDGLVEEIVRYREWEAAGIVTLRHRGGEDRVMRLDSGNEFLLALDDGREAASVPDIIVVVASRTWQVRGVEDLVEGEPVSVLKIPRPPFWDHPDRLELVGLHMHGLGELPVSEEQS